MTNHKDTGERQQKFIVFLLFIVLILISIVVGTFNKINLLELYEKGLDRKSVV